MATIPYNHKAIEKNGVKTGKRIQSTSKKMKMVKDQNTTVLTCSHIHQEMVFM